MVSDSMGRMRQLYNLLEYLVVHRGENVSQSTLIDTLWSDEGSDNPANALKNLIYRLRTLLAQTFGEDVPFIESKRGVYRFSAEVPCVVDVEEFSKALALAGEEGRPTDERIRHYKEAIGLYRGHFLEQNAFENWVVPLSTYYRRKYMEAVASACELLGKEERYAECISLCEKAAEFDPFEEFLHEIILNAYIKENSHKKALDYYHYVTNLFYNELGIKVSDRIRRHYREISKQIHDVEMDLSVIKEDLQETQKTEGAFLCDYEVFKNLYRVEARSLLRSGKSIYILQLTLMTPQRETPEKELLSPAVQALENAVLHSLRQGDAVARFSPSQFVVMLPGVTYENGKMVANRVLERFQSMQRGRDRQKVQVEYCLAPVEPAGEI